MEHSDFKNKIYQQPDKFVINLDIKHINKSFLYALIYPNIDSDGYEYPYNLFYFSQFPSTIEKLLIL